MSKLRPVVRVTALNTGRKSALVPSSVPPSAGTSITRKGWLLLPSWVESAVAATVATRVALISVVRSSFLANIRITPARLGKRKIVLGIDAQLNSVGAKPRQRVLDRGIVATGDVDTLDPQLW